MKVAAQRVEASRYRLKVRINNVAIAQYYEEARVSVPDQYRRRLESWLMSHDKRGNL